MGADSQIISGPGREDTPDSDDHGTMTLKDCCHGLICKTLSAPSGDAEFSGTCAYQRGCGKKNDFARRTKIAAVTSAARAAAVSAGRTGEGRTLLWACRLWPVGAPIHAQRRFANGFGGRAENYCRRYRPAARMHHPVDTGTNHISFRCIVRPG